MGVRRRAVNLLAMPECPGGGCFELDEIEPDLLYEPLVAETFRVLEARPVDLADPEFGTDKRPLPVLLLEFTEVLGTAGDQ